MPVRTLRIGLRQAFLIAALVAATAFLFALQPRPALAGEIYSGPAWSIVATSTDYVAPPMDIYLDDVAQGTAQRVQIHHLVPGGLGFPEVAVIDSPGYLRLKPARDPSPFGASFILGPAYWSQADGVLFHHPDLESLRIDTSGVDATTGLGPLRLTIEGQNGSFETTYQGTLTDPTGTLASFDVTQTCCATTTVSIDPVRQSQHQGFKIAQFSSMFVDPTDYHDCDAAQYWDGGGQEVLSALSNQDRFVFADPAAMGRSWIKLRHSDELGWQGATPSTAIWLADRGSSPRMTPQGWIRQTADWNDDNVGLWINDDSVPMDWQSGDATSVAYSLRSSLDNTPPAVFVAAPGLSTQASAELTFAVSWGGVDPSGMSAWEVLQRADTTTTWTSWQNWTGSAGARFRGRPGRTYSFSMRGEDRAGNTSAWSAPMRTVVPLDQNAFRFVGRWGTTSRAALYLRTARYSSVRGAYATRTFGTGTTRLVLVATKRRDAGRAAVWVDGVRRAIVDLYSRSLVYRSPVWSRPVNSARRHTLKVVVLGAKRAASLGRRVEIDAVAATR